MTIEMALWLLWSVLCAYSVRWTVVRLLQSRVGWASFPSAYTAWLLLFAIGWMIFIKSGFNFKQPPGSARGSELIVYFICIWSPLGLPIILGAGPVLLWDALVVLGKSWRARQRRPAA